MIAFLQNAKTRFIFHSSLFTASPWLLTQLDSHAARENDGGRGVRWRKVVFILARSAGVDIPIWLTPNRHLSWRKVRAS